MRVKPIAVWPSIDIIMFPPITPKNPQRKMIQYYVKIALAVVATFLLPIAPLMALVGAAINICIVKRCVRNSPTR